MTDARADGWPDPQRPGVPENPERDGEHVIRTTLGVRLVVSWNAAAQGTVGVDGVARPIDPACEYLGPYLTPAEVAARISAAVDRAITLGREVRRGR